MSDAEAKPFIEDDVEAKCWSLIYAAILPGLSDVYTFTERANVASRAADLAVSRLRQRRTRGR